MWGLKTITVPVVIGALGVVKKGIEKHIDKIPGKINTTELQQEKHSRNVQNTRLGLVLSTFPSCCQMPVVFYHSVIHGLGFFIC